ncbi:MAG: hypothetical protein P4M08_06625 [Oligoflexia bacterium]|nr:hypothetical protein [Oligoflexia bacterium]
MKKKGDAKAHPAAQAAAGAGEMMKKVLTVGLGSVFLSDEGLRGLMSDIKLPKELLGGILDSANKTKNEFLQGLSQDIINRVSEKMDPVSFLQEFLSRNEVELKINISVKQRKPGSDKIGE